MTLERNCVFLNLERQCSMYDLRPSGCRYYLSVSPPEHCSSASAVPPELVNSTPFQVPMAALTLRLEAEPGLSEFDGGGPLPLMIIRALHRLRPEDEDVRAACESLPRPAIWASHYLERRIGRHERELRVIRNSSSVMECRRRMPET